MADLKPEHDPASQAVPSGWHSSEAWLTLVAVLVSAILGSGLLSDADPTQALVLKVLGIVGTVLGALGYTVSRTALKREVARGAAAIAQAEAEASITIDPSDVQLVGGIHNRPEDS